MYVLLKSYEELDREYGFTKLGFVGDTDIVNGTEVPFEMGKLLGKAHKATQNKERKVWTIDGINFPYFFIKQIYKDKKETYLQQKLNEILEIIPTELDDNTTDELYEILEEVYSAGYCDGDDNALKNY